MSFGGYKGAAEANHEHRSCSDYDSLNVLEEIFLTWLREQSRSAVGLLQ